MTKTKILIIDDTLALALSFKIGLEDTGEYEVQIETVSTQALATAQSYQPDVILLDIIMPEMDGGDVNALLKADSKLKDVPVLMVTSQVSKNEMGSDGFMESGGLIRIAKPVKLEILTRAIEGVLMGTL